MIEVTESRSPQVIAAEIRSIDTQTREIVLRSAIEIGKRLHEAKALVSHGEWGIWLESHVNYGQSTANNFMRIADEYGSNFQAIENLSYTKALSLLGIPGEEREQFIAENDVEGKSSRELQKAIKEKQKLMEQLEKAKQEREETAKSLEKLEQKSKDHAIEIERLKTELADANADFDDEKAEKLEAGLKESQEKLENSQRRIKELEEELKKKPIDVSAVVEKIPEAIEQELEELRKKAAQPNTASGVKFKLQFNQMTTGFRELLTSLEEIRTDNPEAYEKYKGAIKELIAKMSERL